MHSIELSELAELLNNRHGIAESMFTDAHSAVEETVSLTRAEYGADDRWEHMLANASQDIIAWSKGGKPKTYTPESLATARLTRKCANDTESVLARHLLLLNATHQA